MNASRQNTGLHLKSFEAVYNHGKVYIYWTITFEKAIKNYYIERSNDGKNFEIIKTMPAVGELAIEFDYFEMDENICSGKYYYRLVAEDIYGEKFISYSAVAICNKEDKSFNVITPEDTPLHLCEKPNKVLLVLRNKNGEEFYGIFCYYHTPYGIKIINGENIPPGEYIVTGASDQQLYASTLRIF